MSHNKTVYVVLTQTGTLFSQTIKLFTRDSLNHASIAFDEALTEVYSFGRKSFHNPFIAGLIREQFTEPFYKDTYCAIVKFEVDEEHYTWMKARVGEMFRNRDQYRYHLFGLFGVLLNRSFQRERAFFCSQFVAYLFEEAGCQALTKPSYLVRPTDFCRSIWATTIYQGPLAQYIGHLNRIYSA